METILEYSPAVQLVQQYEHQLNGAVEQFNAIVLLIEGSRLSV